MSAEIVNLRCARKARNRAEKEASAAENRAKFGRTKVERRLDTAREQHAKRHLDDHQIDAPGGALAPRESPSDTRN